LDRWCVFTRQPVAGSGKAKNEPPTVSESANGIAALPNSLSRSWRNEPNCWRAIARPLLGSSANAGLRSLTPSIIGVDRQRRRCLANTSGPFANGLGTTRKVRLGRFAYPSTGKGLAAATWFCICLRPSEQRQICRIAWSISRERGPAGVAHTRPSLAESRGPGGRVWGDTWGPSLADRNGPGGSIGRSVQLTLSAR
jgi:hypothetical protein